MAKTYKNIFLDTKPWPWQWLLLLFRRQRQSFPKKKYGIQTLKKSVTTYSNRHKGSGEFLHSPNAITNFQYLSLCTDLGLLITVTIF